MPELPEVETIKNQLRDKILRKKVIGVEIAREKMINVPATEFKKKVEGALIKNIRRRAKVLIVDLSNDYSLIVHLKMTGQLIYNGEEGIGTPHIVYTFSDKTQLRHYDFRMFGYAKLLKTDEVEDFILKNGFGPEILEKDFTLSKFAELLKKKKKSKIKPLLMDQSFIAGVGNIYAQEACFCAGILPSRPVGKLGDLEIKDLYNCLKNILSSAIEYKGSSVDSYVDASGKKGGYVPRLKVYGRKDEKCYKCKKIIKTIKLGGRGTSFCPGCQK
jgi:formamidopyrimidine-DNA glycosylase